MSAHDRDRVVRPIECRGEEFRGGLFALPFSGVAQPAHDPVPRRARHDLHPEVGRWPRFIPAIPYAFAFGGHSKSDSNSDAESDGRFAGRMSQGVARAFATLPPDTR